VADGNMELRVNREIFRSGVLQHGRIQDAEDVVRDVNAELAPPPKKILHTELSGYTWRARAT